MPLVGDADTDLNRRELRRYLARVSDRWQLSEAKLGGAQIDDLNGALPQRERGPEFIVVLISEFFHGIPWLERVYQAGNLWDQSEMKHDADIHCYTPDELTRKVVQLPRVAKTVNEGVDLLNDL